MNNKMKKFALSNGMPVVYAGRSKDVSVCLSVNVGHVNEPKLAIANLFERILLFQTKGLIPVFGGTMTAYRVGCDDVEDALYKIKALFDATEVTEEYLQKAKDIITRETLDRAPLIDRQMRLMYKHTAFGAELVKSTEEYLAALQSYTVDEVREFGNTYYVAANCVLTVASPTFFDLELKQTAEKLLGSVPPGKALPKFAGNLYGGGFTRVEVCEDFTGNRVMLGWDLKHLTESDSPAANVMMTMFSGRLERALKEHGITDYTFEWKIAGYYGLRTMRVYIISPTASPKKIVDVVAAVVNRICETEADQSRMEKSRARSSVERYFRFDKSDDMALEMAWQMIGRAHTYDVDERIGAVFEVSAHDVKVVSREVFRKPRPTYVVAAKAGAELYSYEEVCEKLKTGKTY